MLEENAAKPFRGMQLTKEESYTKHIISNYGYELKTT